MTYGFRQLIMYAIYMFLSGYELENKSKNIKKKKIVSPRTFMSKLLNELIICISPVIKIIFELSTLLELKLP